LPVLRLNLPGTRRTCGLAVFLVLSAYVFTVAAIFMIGVQLDELLRKKT
jgi:hypothetical protein